MQHMPGEPDIEIGYRLLIPVVHVGALIGRGGEAIAQLRQRTGARVKVHDAHDSEQHFHLSVHPRSSTRAVSVSCVVAEWVVCLMHVFCLCWKLLSIHLDLSAQSASNRDARVQTKFHPTLPVVWISVACKPVRVQARYSQLCRMLRLHAGLQPVLSLYRVAQCTNFLAFHSVV